MNQTCTTKCVADLASEANAIEPLTAARRGDLCVRGARLLHEHNGRKRAIDSGRYFPARSPGYDARPTDRAVLEADTQVAVAAWQESNMAASAGETLLSRVLGRMGDRLGPPEAPGLIAEVVEMRARASDLLYDALVLLRQRAR